MKGIFLTGGSGKLGQELLKIDPLIIAPGSSVFNILNHNIILYSYIKKNVRPIDIFVHAAAYTDQSGAEKNPEIAREINIQGTLNMVNLCSMLKIPFIFISTSYVFDGKNPPYATDAPINPINLYAITKTAGEMITKTYSNSMIIRTSFLPVKLEYEKAATDQFTNRDYVDIIAKLIYNKISNFSPGVCHIGTERKNMFELVKRRSPNVKEMSISSLPHMAPKDVSFKRDNGEFV